MTDLKDLSEQLASYIADAEKLERVIEAFRELDKQTWQGSGGLKISSTAYLKFKGIIDDE